MSHPILIDSFFQGTPHGHGGDRRTAQIAELIAQANLEATQFPRKILSSGRDRYLAGAKAILNPNTYRFIQRHKLNIQSSPNAIAFCGFQRYLYQEVLNSHTGNKLIIWEATKNYVAPYVSKDSGFKIIALPHNLESLVPNQKSVVENLETEVQALAQADAVFCIAREEEWFLRLKGISAFFLPYYPPQAVVNQLLEIRSARSQTSPQRFLILGNADNLPTRNGMIEQLAWLHQVRETTEFQVDIVGYSTEKLKPYCCHPDFTLHGGVSSEQLNVFLAQAKAVLVHQTAGAGALTRIPETLIAGIPIIANGNACRSAFNYPGVFCYDSWVELADLISQPLAIPPPFSRPIAAEKRFIDCLHQLASHSL